MTFQVRFRIDALNTSAGLVSAFADQLLTRSKWAATFASASAKTQAWA